MDLANTMLHVQVKVTRAKGDDLDSTPSTNTYAYRAYTETLLSYGTDAKDTDESAVAQGHGHSHGRRRDSRRTRG